MQSDIFSHNASCLPNLNSEQHSISQDRISHIMAGSNSNTLPAASKRLYQPGRPPPTRHHVSITKVQRNVRACKCWLGSTHPSRLPPDVTIRVLGRDRHHGWGTRFLCLPSVPRCWAISGAGGPPQALWRVLRLWPWRQVTVGTSLTHHAVTPVLWL